MPHYAVALICKLPIPVPHETMTPLTMPVVDSQLEFFEVANYNLNNGSDPTLFDYHSSDNIFITLMLCSVLWKMLTVAKDLVG